MVSPSSLPESQDQPSSQEHDIPLTEQAPPVEQVQQISSPALVLQEEIPGTPSIHTLEAYPEVSLPDTHIPAPIVQIPIEEPPVNSATQTGEPQFSSPQVSQEPIQEPIQISDSPLPSVDTYHPPDAYAQIFEENPPSATQPSISPAQQQQVPPSTSTHSEWHRHGSTSEQPSSLFTKLFSIFLINLCSVLSPPVQIRVKVCCV